MWGATGFLERSEQAGPRARILELAQLAACQELHLLFLTTEGGASILKRQLQTEGWTRGASGPNFL